LVSPLGRHASRYSAVDLIILVLYFTPKIEAENSSEMFVNRLLNCTASWPIRPPSKYLQSWKLLTFKNYYFNFIVQGSSNMDAVCANMPVTVAEWSKAWTVLARLDVGIVDSNPTRGMDVYVYVYLHSMFVLSCVGTGLAMSWSFVQGDLPTVLD
jgi:hypothetical protein